jgi:hypothetical protein
LKIESVIEEVLIRASPTFPPAAGEGKAFKHYRLRPFAREWEKVPEGRMRAFAGMTK